MAIVANGIIIGDRATNANRSHALRMAAHVIFNPLITKMGRKTKNSERDSASLVILKPEPRIGRINEAVKARRTETDSKHGSVPDNDSG